VTACQTSTAATVRAALANVTAVLAAAGIDSARLDARVLVAHALGLEGAVLLTQGERRLSEEEEGRVAALVARRARREPVAHLVGAREFWGLSFKVSRDTLIPRPESETLVEAALSFVADRARPLALLDLGTGTGCLLLALLAELPRAWGVGVDVSASALELARANAAALGLADRAFWVEADWTSGLGGRFDLVVANPPYVPDDAIATLAPEVARYEPRIALAGGADGLVFYRALSRRLPTVLAPDGVACLEVGHGQAAPVAGLLHAAGLAVRDIRRDLADVERCVVVSLVG
jgi:release factor glutamine methyltransferase